MSFDPNDLRVQCEHGWSRPHQHCPGEKTLTEACRCQTCGGTGRGCDCFKPDGREHTTHHFCPDCDGSGWDPEKVERRCDVGASQSVCLRLHADDVRCGWFPKVGRLT